jgi:hypothetical protein
MKMAENWMFPQMGYPIAGWFMSENPSING